MELPMKKLALIAIATLAFSAHAGKGAKLYKEKGCVACHGKAGKKPTMGSYPKLNGQNKDYLINQMKDIKSGKRSNSQSAVMKGVIANVSKKEIKAIAKYLSKVK